MDYLEASKILKHFYGVEHRDYPYCPQCVEWNIKALKTRLRAKYGAA